MSAPPGTRGRWALHLVDEVAPTLPTYDQDWPRHPAPERRRSGHSRDLLFWAGERPGAGQVGRPGRIHLRRSEEHHVDPPAPRVVEQIRNREFPAAPLQESGVFG